MTIRFAGLVTLMVLGACAPRSGSTVVRRAADSQAKEPTPMQRCLMESSPAEVNFDEAPSRVTVSHVLVKHVDVDRPAPGVTRSRGEACMRARQALEELKSGKDFEEVVKAFSDERGASTRAGSLGAIEPSQVDPAFARAAFALEIQQVSHVVESRAGFHIVLRTR